MSDKQDIPDWLDEHEMRFTRMSDEIWDNPELQFLEFKASKLQADFLADEGFRITWDIGGLSTAFAAEWGAGKPVIAFAGEYDALPGLSQKDQKEPDPISAGEPGHGCGHNLLGTGCLAAALAFKIWLGSSGHSGTVRYYGCPAEEGGSGKVFMGRAGAFDDLDATFNWHPWYINSAMKGSLLSVNRYYFRFHGKTAHAAADPHSGRSALDALELMNIGVNYLREHVTDDVRLHYAILSGGLAPNVVPDYAESYYYVRANEPDTLEDVSQRVIRIAKGAAMMTDTEVETVYKSGSTRVLSNEVLADLQYDVMRDLGGIEFTDRRASLRRRDQPAFRRRQRQDACQSLRRRSTYGGASAYRRCLAQPRQGCRLARFIRYGRYELVRALQHVANGDLGQPRRSALLGCGRQRAHINWS